MAMYTTKQDFQVRAGWLTQFEAFGGKLFELFDKQEGFLRATLLNSLGYPTKYTIFATWESREAARALGHSSALTQLLAESTPRELAIPLTPVEAFEVVHRASGGNSGARVAYIIDQKCGSAPGQAQAYEDARHKLFLVRKQHGTGFVVNILARFLGGGNRYIVFGAYTDAKSEAETAAHPELIAYWKAYGAQTIPIATETREPYEVVRAVGTRPVPEL